MADVTRLNEVSLFGNFYRIVGPVKPTETTPMAQKIVTGDYTKDSARWYSSVTWSDQRGGLGIKDMVETKDPDRFYFSTANVDFRGHLLLPPLATDCTNPTSSDAAVLIEYNNFMHCAFGTDLRRWAEGSASWGATLGALIATPTSAVVHKSKLYLACGTDFNRWDGATLTTGAALSGGVVATRYLIEWDSKLFSLSNAGVLKYSDDEGVTWTTIATSTLETGNFTSLFLDFMGGDMVVQMGTKMGVQALDYGSAKWSDPHLTFPSHDYAGLGAGRWRDGAHIPVGMGMYEIQTQGSIPVVTPMGPDRDFGIPSDYRGNIIGVIGEHNHLFALVDATSEEARDTYTGSYVIDGVFYDDVGYSSVLKWNGRGWSTLHLGSSTGGAVKCAAVATADDIYRLWFGIDSTVKYIPLNVGLQNPLEITDYTYAASSEHIYPWFDADNAVADKAAFAVSAYCGGMSATEYIKVYYGLNGDDDTWTLLTNTDYPDGQIDADGEAVFTLASGAGLQFNSIRFKVEHYRGATTTVSPDLQWLRLDYVKAFDQEQTFEFVVDCGRDYRFKRASTLVANLKTAVETKTLGNFVYRTYRGTSESFNVRALALQGVTEAGRKKEGQFQVTLLAL